ncbi:MAG: transcriptional regulator [Alphaproteobacteria bacterium HGW-Alphaproteobacteria-12]|nr:MAG: transcriptional regulator [Alphaproteobacteria bacterium HGW-Alphaproteobacteria-12]
MSNFAKELIASMEEAVTHAQGKKTGVRVHAIEPVDVKKARKALDMTQPDFALLLGTSVSGLQKWEQGKRYPGGAARTLIRLIERAPEAVKEALDERNSA